MQHNQQLSNMSGWIFDLETLPAMAFHVLTQVRTKAATHIANATTYHRCAYLEKLVLLNRYLARKIDRPYFCSLSES